jgi:hypothetical protein
MKSRRLVRTAAVLALCAGLAACEGSDGGVEVISSPAPTPTPTAHYTPVAQIVGDHTYQTVGATFVLSLLGLTDAATLDSSTGVDIVYTAADDRYTLKLPNGTSIGYGPADILSTDATTGAVHYRLDLSGITFDSDFTRFVPRVNNVPLSYTLMGDWHGDSGQGTYLIVGGVPTIASDMPKSGTANYAVAVVNGAALDSTGSYELVTGGSTGSFTTNFATGAISTSLHIVGKEEFASTIKDFGTLTGTGTIGASSPEFTGTLSQGGGAGSFSGSFFGPQASEMGYSWYFHGAGFNSAGMVAGRKN